MILVPRPSLVRTHRPPSPGRGGIARARGVRAAVVILSLSAACAPAPIATGPRTDLGMAQEAQLLQMVDLRRQDTVLVDAMLGEPSSARRVRAALAIGNVKLRARYAMLRRLLTDSDSSVAASAAYALGVAKDSGAVAMLARAVSTAPEAVAREAAWSLGEIGEVARSALTSALGEGVAQPRTNSTAAQRGSSVRAALLLATAKLQPIPLSVTTPWLADTSSETVRAAAYVIGRSRLAGGVRALLSVRAHRDEETRQHVARGLARQAAGDSLASMARDALAVLVRDESPRVRINAARSLVSFGPSSRREVEQALADPDANVRVAAAEMIQRVFARDTLAWKAAWERDTTFRVRQQLLSGARSVGLMTLARGEGEWVRQSDWRKRLAVVDARAADSSADRLALGREFSRDADPRVRAAAVGLLPRAGGDSVVRAIATAAIGESDIMLRVAGLNALVSRARAADVPLALSAHARAVRDIEGDARTASLRLLAAAWRRDSARIDVAARERLTTFAASGTIAERRLVSAVTPMGPWSRVSPTVAARPVSDYERVARDWLVPGARLPRAVIKTEHGEITVELFASDAPLVVEAFLRLVTSGFYRNTMFHRVVPNFVVQDGDPRGDGSGGPGFALRDSHSRRRHDRGALGLATSGPDTGGSQYYLCHSGQPHLDGGYTVFGHVIDGLAVMDKIVQGDRMLRIDIK